MTFNMFNHIFIFQSMGLSNVTSVYSILTVWANCLRSNRNHLSLSLDFEIGLWYHFLNCTHSFMLNFSLILNWTILCCLYCICSFPGWALALSWTCCFGPRMNQLDRWDFCIAQNREFPFFSQGKTELIFPIPMTCNSWLVNYRLSHKKVCVCAYIWLNLWCDWTYFKIFRFLRK